MNIIYSLLIVFGVTCAMAALLGTWQLVKMLVSLNRRVTDLERERTGRRPYADLHELENIAALIAGYKIRTELEGERLDNALDRLGNMRSSPNGGKSK